MVSRGAFFFFSNEGDQQSDNESITLQLAEKRRAQTQILKAALKSKGAEGLSCQKEDKKKTRRRSLC